MKKALAELQKEIDEAEAEEQNENGLLGLLPEKPAEGGIWRKAVEAETGDTYFYHTATKETQWTRPDGYTTAEDDAWDADEYSSSDSSSDTSDGGNSKEEGAQQIPADPKQVLQYAVYIGESCCPLPRDWSLESRSLLRPSVVKYNILTSSQDLSGRGGGLLSGTCQEQHSTRSRELTRCPVLAGIDPAKEPELLWIAEEGIRAPLPLGYSSHMENGEIYFYHDESKKSSWEHPLDSHYKALVVAHRGRLVGMLDEPGGGLDAVAGPDKPGANGMGDKDEDADQAALFDMRPGVGSKGILSRLRIR